MTKLWDYHEISGKVETFCGRPQVAPTNKFGKQPLDESEVYYFEIRFQNARDCLKGENETALKEMVGYGIFYGRSKFSVGRRGGASVLP